ncbi:MAG TPA: ABC transporter permease [Firmicutes bacterium]|nr:ABC transporter permease [Bacillota bacterium]
MILRTMRDIGTITMNQLKRLVIDPATYIWLFTLPLLITYVLGISLNSLFAPEFKPIRPYNVGLVQHSPIVGAPIMERLESLPQLFTVTVYDDEESMQTDLADNIITAGVVVPADPLVHPVRVVSTPESIVNQILYSVLRPVLDQLMIMSAETVQFTTEVTKTQLTTNTRSNTENEPKTTVAWAQADSFQYYSLAIAVMFAMYAANVAMQYLAADFTSGTFGRIRSFGVTRSRYLFAGYLSAVIMSVLFVTVMTVVTKVFFGVRWGALSAWLPFTLLCGFTSAAITYFILSIVPANPKIIDGAGTLVFNFIAFLGGSTAPLPALPQWLVSFTTWLPNRALLEGYLRLSSGADLASLSNELTVISISLVVLLGLSLIINSVRPKGAL